MAAPASFFTFAERTLGYDIPRLRPGLADRRMVNRTSSRVWVSKAVFRFFCWRAFRKERLVFLENLSYFGVFLNKLINV